MLSHAWPRLTAVLDQSISSGNSLFLCKRNRCRILISCPVSPVCRHSWVCDACSKPSSGVGHSKPIRALFSVHCQAPNLGGTWISLHSQPPPTNRHCNSIGGCYSCARPHCALLAFVFAFITALLLPSSAQWGLCWLMRLTGRARQRSGARPAVLPVQWEHIAQTSMRTHDTPLWHAFINHLLKLSFILKIMISNLLTAATVEESTLRLSLLVVIDICVAVLANSTEIWSSGPDCYWITWLTLTTHSV